MSKRFRPMLAAPVDLPKLIYPVFISPKLDGIRAMVRKGKLLSRSLKRIPNRHIYGQFSHPMFEGIDGELIMGPPTAKDVFQRSDSAVMTEEGKPALQYYLFDYICPDMMYSQRYNKLAKWRNQPGIILVQQRAAYDEVSLREWHAANLAKGYEGSIVRSLIAPYKYGRSTVNEGYLLKWKEYEDDEATIIDFEEKEHNGNRLQTDERGFAKRSHHKAGMVRAGTLGALVVESERWPDVFRIGTGFTDSQRADIWNNKRKYKSRLVKFKFQRAGTKDLPRGPVFLGFRNAADL